jgi:hypothetical protein
MFDWQAGTKTKSLNSDGETGVLSRNFWMYWAVSVPLTIVVLLAWRTWWHREKHHYQHKYPHIKLDRITVQDTGSNLFNRLTGMIWGREKLEDIEMN